MFLEKYLSKFYFDLVLDNYKEFYLKSLDENNFIKIYELLRKYNFYFIDDIILNYLEIFTLNIEEVEEKILELKYLLGDNFVYIIGNDMRYLEKIIS